MTALTRIWMVVVNRFPFSLLSGIIRSRPLYFCGAPRARHSARRSKEGGSWHFRLSIRGTFVPWFGLAKEITSRTVTTVSVPSLTGPSSKGGHLLAVNSRCARNKLPRSS
jgi:hypothetical protein